MSWLDNFKLQKEFSPQDLALMQMGASMMANQRQGFGAALGSGITAGLDEYARGMQMAEGTRHRKALEGLRQQGLNIQRTTVAQDQAQHDASLAQDEYLARQQKLHDLSLLSAQHDQKLALQNDQQDFDFAKSYKEHTYRLREQSGMDLVNLHRSNLLQAQADQINWQTHQLNEESKSGEATKKTNEKVAKEAQENKLWQWLNKSPGSSPSKSPDYTWKQGPRMTWDTELGDVPEALRGEALIHLRDYQRAKELSAKRVEKAYNNLKAGKPIGVDLTAEELKRVNAKFGR